MKAHNTVFLWPDGLLTCSRPSVQGVMVLVEQDAHARKLLSNRTHVMREALTASRSRVRVAAQNNERHRMEVRRAAGV